MDEELIDDDAPATPGKHSAGEEFPDYPQHSETFETYYYLGDRRSLRECASLRFKQYFPDIPSTDPKYPTKFNSFYMKIKRWARKEGWNHWCRKKDKEVLKASQKETQERIMRTRQSVQAYRQVLQQAVFVFAKKAARSMRLVQKAMQIEELLDDPDVTPVRKSELERQLEHINERIESADIRIKSLKEARECMQLEVDLGKAVESLPEVVDGTSKLSEEMAEKVDSIHEFFRKHAKDSVKKEVDVVPN